MNELNNSSQHRVRRLFFATAVATFALPAIADPWRYTNVDRVVAISDVHGAYGAMIETLQSANVIDSELVWSGNASHLVVTGDILDRGPESRDAMDLLMRLENEALHAGGQVHMLIGNHEAMNLVGDLRYVSKAEYASFADEESVAERKRWFDLYTAQRSTSAQDPGNRQQDFDQRFPAGYFAHRRAFGPDGKYGNWLLTKPVMIVIDDTAFVHGGVSPLVGKIGLHGVNETLHNELVTYTNQLKMLTEAELLLPTDSFFDHRELLSEFVPSADVDVLIVQAVADISSLKEYGLRSLEGPLWYRGNVACSALVETDRLAESLQTIGANRVVIGHTPTDGRRVLRRMRGRVIEIDTGMLNGYYNGKGHALIIEHGKPRVISQSNDALQPALHPRGVGERPGDHLSVDDIEALLTDGDIASRSEDEAGRVVVADAAGGVRFNAVFRKRTQRDFYPEVAAYRLDRLLHLDMVPVTVRREIDGVDGSLQFVPENWIDERQRHREGAGGSAWCPLQPQWNAMRVFDVLIHNQRRNRDDILYNLDMWQLMLVGHGASFAAKRSKPKHLESEPIIVGKAWHDALLSLSDERLANSLGDVLNEKRLRLLRVRRDQLLRTD